MVSQLLAIAVEARARRMVMGLENIVRVEFDGCVVNGAFCLDGAGI